MGCNTSTPEYPPVTIQKQRSLKNMELKNLPLPVAKEVYDDSSVLKTVEVFTNGRRISNDRGPPHYSEHVIYPKFNGNRNSLTDTTNTASINTTTTTTTTTGTTTTMTSADTNENTENTNYEPEESFNEEEVKANLESNMLHEPQSPPLHKSNNSLSAVFSSLESTSSSLEQSPVYSTPQPKRKTLVHSYYYHPKKFSKNIVYQNLPSSVSVDNLDPLTPDSIPHLEHTLSLPNISVKNWSPSTKDDPVVVHPSHQENLFLSSFSTPRFPNDPLLTTKPPSSNTHRHSESITMTWKIRKIPPYGKLPRSKSAPAILIPKPKNKEFRRINAYASITGLKFGPRMLVPETVDFRNWRVIKK